MSSTSAEGRAFVDTNVLVYAHDTSAEPKLDVAREVVARLWETKQGCVSIQVLQELYVALRRKLRQPLDATSARHAVEDFGQWLVHAPSQEDVIAAIRLNERYRISFWDAMIVRSASVLGCDVLYSEDLNAGQRYDGVLVVNPFTKHG